MIAWIAAMIYVEAVTEIIIAGDIFAKPRHWIMKVPFLSTLFSCGYCMSVWVAATVVWVLPPLIDRSIAHGVVDMIVKLFVLHRLSNVLHELINRWLKRVPLQLVLTKIEVQSQPNEEKTVDV